MRYKILIFTALMQFGYATSNDGFFSKELIEKQKNKSSYFYITNSDMVKDAETITYFYTHSEPSKKLRNVFFNFANRIGDKNGAMIISPNSNLKKQLDILMDVSKCETIEPNLWPTIVFEDKTNNVCYPFYMNSLSDESKFMEILFIIDKALNDRSIINKKQFIFNTKEDVNRVINNFPNLDVIKRVVFLFIDYLGEKIYS